MKQRPPIGHTGETTFEVGTSDVIDFAEDGMPAVFSTPRLVALLERTARHSLTSFLEPDERSVGVEIDLRHLAPTPMGARVTILTRIISSDGPFVQFAIEARDPQELIARGIHKRAIIRVASFARRVHKKSQPSPP